MHFLKVYLCLISMTLLSACANQKLVDEIKIVQSIGYDLTDHGVKSVVLYPVFEKKNEAQLELLDTSSNSYYDIIPRLNTKTNDPIEYGQLRMVLFGKTYSQKGIDAVIHSLCRDAKIGSRIQLGVAERDASELLTTSKKYKDPFYISGMINQNITHGNLPITNLQEFLFDHYGEGRDPFLPYIILERGNIKIDGIALFSYDRLKTVISMKDAFILKMLVGNSKNGSYMYPLNGPKSDRNEFVLLHSIGSRMKYTVDRIEPTPIISIKVNVKLQVKDVPNQIDLAKEDQLRGLEQRVGSYFEKEIQSFISYCQKNKVDPIGFGDLVRSKSLNWDEEDFYAGYESLKSNVNVIVHIIQTGVGE
ncbi:Ger(x)C family spore germination protein [Paenibacillus sp. LMG 31460]|uniref:Ger(X)C family spore germination protein n=1 Tax=Paenibacillus germinis TaxID=2654979 RepID=A0ABX1YZR9_9BACL|nr:Ger(x)C family spore germination protein [Paenibacillus germinis]NOU86653.1 Ger(x)C family spore germination protein [Paenibacillus germinis]